MTACTMAAMATSSASGLILNRIFCLLVCLVCRKIRNQGDISLCCCPWSVGRGCIFCIYVGNPRLGIVSQFPVDKRFAGFPVMALSAFIDRLLT